MLIGKMKVEKINIFSDPQLVVCHMLREYQAREETMTTYLAQAKDWQPRSKNSISNKSHKQEILTQEALVRLALKNVELLRVISHISRVSQHRKK